MPDLPLSSTPALPDPIDGDRRTWLLATGTAGAAAAAAAAIPFVSSLTPSDRARAMGAPVEVDIADLPPGALRTVEWRGRPVWIVRRTPQMIAALSGQEQRLADPGSQKNQQPDYARNAGRSVNPQVLVAVGVCTHLGCSPMAVPPGDANASLGDDWQGGFFCPCHGSTFDGAGRVFKNKPAPTNLEIPPHRYLSATRILIGDDAA